MKKEINDRVIQSINHIIDNNIVSTKKELADVFQISQSKFSEILKNRMNAGIEIFRILFEEYQINPTWLLTNQGEMILSETPSPTLGKTSSDIELSKQYIDDLKERIDELKNEKAELNSDVKELRKKLEETEQKLNTAEKFIAQHSPTEYDKYRSKIA